MEFALMGLGTSEAIPNDIASFQRSYSLNTGNLLFNYAAKILCNVSSQKMSWGTSPTVINRSCRGLLIPMANHLGEHVNLGESGPKLSGIELPVVILGIGVQSKLGNDPVLPQGTKEWLDRIGEMKASSSPNISTRGPSSSRTITQNAPKVDSIPLGCPSYLINRHRELGSMIAERIEAIDISNISIAVSAGNPYKRELNPVEHKLISFVELTNGSYIVQHPKIMIELSLGYATDEKASEIARKSFFPKLDTNELSRWMRRYSRVYTSVSQWITDIRRYDIHVGTRIHGSQAAIQAGVPSVCLYIDSRTKELCEQMNIPHASALDFLEDLSIENLVKVVSSWDWNKYDQLRQANASHTLQFLQDNGVTPSEHLKKLVG